MLAKNGESNPRTSGANGFGPFQVVLGHPLLTLHDLCQRILHKFPVAGIGEISAAGGELRNVSHVPDVTIEFLADGYGCKK